MVLRNWYNVMKVCMSKQKFTKAVTLPSGSKADAYYNSSMELKWLILSPNSGLAFSTYPDNYNSYFLLGRGTTPATVDDYNLEDMITSGLSCSVTTVVDEDNDACYKLTLTNTSSESITIGEVGILSPFYDSTSSSGRDQALMERTVLNTPITIPAGGIGVIDYCIKIPIPTA